MCHLVDEKEDAKSFYLGARTLRLKNSQSFGLTYDIPLPVTEEAFSQG
jgi:hypothetical protein